jgi:hypothetical protein
VAAQDRDQAVHLGMSFADGFVAEVTRLVDGLDLDERAHRRAYA